MQFIPFILGGFIGIIALASVIDNTDFPPFGVKTHKLLNILMLLVTGMSSHAIGNVISRVASQGDINTITLIGTHWTIWIIGIIIYNTSIKSRSQAQVTCD